MRRLWTKRGSPALLIGLAGGFPARMWTGEALEVFLFFISPGFLFLSVFSREPARRSRFILAFCVSLLGCHVSSSIVLRYNERPAACAALTASSSITPLPSFLPPPHPHPPPPFCALLCYFKWSGASWVLQCLSRACLVTYGGNGSPQRTTIPRVPRGPHQSIRLQHIRGDGVGGGGGGWGRICRDQYGV